MSDNWQVGDLALCVDGSPLRMSGWRGAPFPGRAGAIYRVVGLGRAGTENCSLFLEGLTAVYQHAGFGFSTTRFRKIRPDEHEACEPEFVTLLKRAKVSA